MFKSQWFPGPTINTFVVGTQAKSLMLNNRKTFAIGALFAATITIGAAVAAAILNGGSILAAFDEIGFTDNGVKRLQYDPRAAGFLTGALMPSARSRAVLTSTAIAATTLREMVILFFGHPYQMDPGETAYQEQDPKAELALYVIPNASVTSGIAIATPGGGGTVAVTGVTIETIQYYSLDTTVPALMRPYVETRDYAIATTGANQELSHRTDRFLRYLLYFTDSLLTGGASTGARRQETDILSALAVRSDDRFLVGENAISINALNAFNDQWQGESFVGTPATLLNFQQFGRLAAVVDPRIDQNLRSLATAAPTATANTTGSRIRVALGGLERIAGVTAKVVPFLDGAGAVATQ